MKLVRRRRFIWAVLALSVFLTWSAWQLSSNAIENGLQNTIDSYAEDIGVAISKRIGDQERVLRAGVGLFDASESVSRDEFRDFVHTLQISQNYPGLQGYGYAKLIQPEELDAHIDAVRREGFHDYTVKPEGERSLYTSIVYLEPFDWRNKRAFGYDMFSQATRRKAMERARDTAQPSMTGAVTLVQETQTDTQRGFLIYLPVYEKPVAPLTLEGRRKSLRGFVYSPFRMNDLMEGVLGTAKKNARLRIFDGSSTAASDLLYDSHAGQADPVTGPDKKWQRVKRLQFGDRSWTLEFIPDMSAMGSAANSQVAIIGAGGFAIDLLLFYVIVSVSRRMAEARALAKDMTRDLRAQTRRSQQILDTIGDGIATTDAAGRIVTLNPAGCRLFGYTSEAAQSLDIADLVPLAGESLRRRIADRRGWTNCVSAVRTTGTSRSGEEVQVAFSLAPVPDSNGEVWTWVLRDISERTRIEKIQREFIAVVSHELRTPLTALSGSLSILQHSMPGLAEDRLQSLVSLANNNANRLALLVNDILDMEKVKAGDIDYHMRAMDLIPLLEDVRAEHAQLAAQSGNTLQIDCSLSSAMVRADRHRLHQILSNLLSNALKFNRPGGTVTLSLHKKAKGLRIAVTDEGPGIDRRDRSRIFESFYQIDSLEKPDQRGTGLGLPIARAIAEAHDSRLRVTSRPGKGATFFLTLPEAGADVRESEDFSGAEENRKIVLDTATVVV